MKREKLTTTKSSTYAYEDVLNKTCGSWGYADVDIGDESAKRVKLFTKIRSIVKGANIAYIDFKKLVNFGRKN
ncbi:hypothetical protein A2W32_02480 [candidate division WWE3 bacterium RBG_16_37_10]|uniref:Uncharacterized protein n=1 Tax=candidate division WWE3 bacterium RBG_16_37_10 TaxID=1802610 RepID=A0A1F4UTU2_UNCKA|nr:MAG: hypothetical protein A2W32_02480 [candidate division WWE3 bacterium RBG_16_37_10]